MITNYVKCGRARVKNAMNALELIDANEKEEPENFDIEPKWVELELVPEISTIKHAQPKI